MCGIAGYISMSDKRPNKTKLEEMFVEIQSRGKDASGFAILDKKGLYVAKGPMQANELITKKSWRSLKKLPPIMIMHTRAATQGDRLINTNNHPITHEHYAMVHNGVINNEADFDVPLTVVDSLAIVKSWQQNEEDISKVFASLEGSFAVGMLDSKQPNKLTLFRHNNPIEVLFDTHDEILYFASTTWAVKKVKQNYEKTIKGFPVEDRYQELNFTNDSYWEITTEEGLTNYIDKLEAKPRVYTYTHSNYSRNKNYDHWKYNGAYGQYSFDEEYDGDWQNPPNKETKQLPAPKEEYGSDVLFLEYLEPHTRADYDAVNDKLSTSDFIAIECDKCERPTIINKNEVNPICHQCKTKLNKEQTYVN